MTATASAASSTALHEVAVLAVDNVVGFELGLPHKLMGGATDAHDRPLYRVRVCTVDGGPVRSSAGYRILPEHDASIMRDADTVVVPGTFSHQATVSGTIEPALARALTGTNARMISICVGAFARRSRTA